MVGTPAFRATRFSGLSPPYKYSPAHHPTARGALGGGDLILRQLRGNLRAQRARLFVAVQGGEIETTCAPRRGRARSHPSRTTGRGREIFARPRRHMPANRWSAMHGIATFCLLSGARAASFRLSMAVSETGIPFRDHAPMARSIAASAASGVSGLTQRRSGRCAKGAFMRGG